MKDTCSECVNIYAHVNKNTSIEMWNTYLWVCIFVSRKTKRDGERVTEGGDGGVGKGVEERERDPF